MGRKKGSECSQASAKVVKSKKKFKNPFKAAEKKPVTPAEPAKAPEPSPGGRSLVGWKIDKSGKRRRKTLKERILAGDVDTSGWGDEELLRAMGRKKKGKPVPKLTGWPYDEWRDFSPEAKKAVMEFVNRYGEMGEEGVKAEYKKEIEGYKSATYSDIAWQANPTKNRDKDLMTCLDDTRVLLDDKKYINASWVYDLQWVQRMYIDTQKPIVPQKTGDESTLEDFYQMIVERKPVAIVEFMETNSYNGKDATGEVATGQFGTGPYADILQDKFYPVGKEKKLELSNFIVENSCEPGNQEAQLKITQRTCKESHEHKEECNAKPLEVVLIRHKADAWGPPGMRRLTKMVAKVEKEAEGTLPPGAQPETHPIILIDEKSGISKAAMFAAIDIMGTILHKGNPINHTLVEIVRWIRRCRNGAIVTEDEYLSIVRTLFILFYCRAGYDKWSGKTKEWFAKLTDRPLF